MTAPLLQIADLRLAFDSWRGPVEVLHGISLNIRRGEKVALVGESGSGKSVTARIIAGLLQYQRGTRVSGHVAFDRTDLLGLSERAFRDLRGTAMSMVFQDPTSALNPVFTIADQFREVLGRAHKDISRAEARRRAAEALDHVLIHEPERVLASYPFQLSGGMNQRVLIAMALANQPALLLADEPGTALDVTVQDRTLHLMADLIEEVGSAVLFISHNLGVVREFADRVYVIYRGRIVEHAGTDALFHDPRHPYTRALLAAVPKISGEGLPDTLVETSDAFDAPAAIHEGCEEPPLPSGMAA
ncbi:MAG: ABC transporter ATP-binding protein [Pseudomonadota bacterium]